MAYTEEELIAHRGEWVAALRSGEYRQTRGALRKAKEGGYERDGYCCLGVLCQISGLVKWVKGDGIVYASTKDVRHPSLLPAEVMAWAGLRTPIGNFYDGAQNSSLISYNDHGVSFHDIADIIAKEPTALFQ